MGARLLKMKFDPSSNGAATASLPKEADIYPIRNLTNVIDVFKAELKKGNDADLALLSILAGYVEDFFTGSRTASSTNVQQTNGHAPKSSQRNKKSANNGSILDTDIISPPLTREQLDAMRQKFVSRIRGFCDLSLIPDLGKCANMALIKRVSDIIWNTLNEERHMDRGHTSNIFSYLTEAKVNCFGLAVSVVAGCQALGFNDVHLAMSEDHAWVVYGPRGEHTAEVTWHERIPADRRGEPLDTEQTTKSWLYSGGHPVICNRGMEIAAIITAINPSATATINSQEIVELQRELLWTVYDSGHLARYPMGLGTLAEYVEEGEEDGHPDPNRTNVITPEQLYAKAISANEKLYGNRHIYPYLFSAGFFQRVGNHVKAFTNWANASQTLRFYTYKKEDDEIYKEFLDISSEVIPNIIKSHESLVTDPRIFADLVRFCDGLCSWEEEGATPVLHVGWTKAIIKNITAFPFPVRNKVKFVPASSISGQRRRGNDDSVELYSGKMIGLIPVLESDKMNTGALQLQLTAQAQIESRRKSETADTSSRAKRLKKSL
eukprot:TRINITY_DN28635_c0_g1_i12.p1 TRINITY_DN28635_c0_g1~~TRINITY_DN28635_c0_g1_i12.p1  ORF type:complete len:549 (-),score=101.95 TRINITY_DN28635_c0_g1_i12:665-2311(-)